MRLERLLAIIVMLINRRMVRAAELADHFGVSIRTIYRDMNAVADAGIPVVPVQGVGGGYTLVAGFRLGGTFGM